MNTRYVFLLTSLLLAGAARAHQHFGEATINAARLQEFAKPSLQLNSQDLQHNHGFDIGSLLEQQAGISNAAFGAGVGRPVMRGMHGSRVKILHNGSDSADVSAMSSDHAPMAELAHAHGVEVLHGANTLLHGGGAIGGVVNVLDDNIISTPLLGSQGYVYANGGSNGASADFGAAANIGNELFALHLSGMHRQSADYDAGASKSRHIHNSDTHAKGASLGLSYTHDNNNYLGVSFENYAYDYGVPNPENLAARVRPEQRRYQLRAKLSAADSWLKAWHSNISYSDYRHDEYTAPIVQALFLQQQFELNSSLQHAEFWGWSGTLGFAYTLRELQLCHDHSGCHGIADHSNIAWNGNSGMLLKLNNGLLFAHDTPMPATKTRDVGVFLVETRKLNNVELSLGARLDYRQIQSDPNVVDINYRRERNYYATLNFAPISLVASSTWQLANNQQIGISLSKAERAPDAQELLWNGDHHATFAYQLDNRQLGTETAHSLDLHWQNQQLRAAFYYYDFKNFIFNQNQGVRDPYHGNPAYRHEQHGAVFMGTELSFVRQLTDNFSFYSHFDLVSAKLKHGKNRNIPRTPPASILAKLSYKNRNWQAQLSNHYHFKAQHLAAYETPSRAFNNVAAYIGYNPNFANVALNVGLQISNIFNSYGQNHVSYLKEYAPYSGRNIKLQLRAEF